MEQLEDSRTKLREQAYNHLTLVAGNLMLMGAGIYIAVEDKPVAGSVVAVGAGSVGALFSKLGVCELLDSMKR